ncbi:hypothetical protein Tco_0671951, partial [Tanacetum coccineum]
PPAPKTAKQLTAKRNQERVKSILLLAIPDEYLLKFHNVPDAKSLWAAIKSRFGGNDESKKMQRNVLKLSNEDINQKFLRSLPPSWSQIALIMRNKPDIDHIDIDDFYNNLRVYEDEMKRTNEVSTVSGDFRVSTARGTSSPSHISSTPCADEVMFPFFAQPDIDDDALVSLVRESMKEKEADFVTHTKASALGERRAMSANKGKEISTGLDFFSAAKERLNSAEVEVNIEVNPGSAGVNTGNTPISTSSVVHTVNVTIPSPVKDQREGKAPITVEDVQATQKTKAQIEQEKAGLAEAMRLQALQDEEAARQVHLDALLAKRIQEEQELSEQQQKRKAKVQEAAQYYTKKDWDTIRAKLEENAELTKSLQ